MKKVRKCSVEGCEGTYKAKGFCTKHYQRILKHGTIDPPVKKRKIKRRRKRNCKVPDCLRKAVYGRNGYCGKHYWQICKYGKILQRVSSDPNEIIDYGDYIGICLYNKNNEKVAEALGDKSDLELVKKHKWCLSVYGYVKTQISRKEKKMHQIICPENKLTDHINRDKLNNRRCNLRKCTHSQNNMNRAVHQNNTSGVAGVYFNKKMNKWRGFIKIKNKEKHLGYFSNFDQAVQIRKQAEQQLFGEFASK